MLMRFPRRFHMTAFPFNEITQPRISLLSVLLICYCKSVGISATLQKFARTDDNRLKSCNNQYVCFWFYFEMHDS